MLQKIFQVIYPKVCGICGKKINERYTCENCLNIIEYYREMKWKGKQKEIFYDELLCLFPYKGLLKSKMLLLKFHGYQYIAKTFGDILARRIEKKQITADMIIPVPISSKRMFERGFNQCELIANNLTKFLHIPTDTKVLYKTKNNFVQSELKAQMRTQNVSGVYQIKNQGIIDGKTILLLDDIYTTGATINECARVLKEAHASKVIAVTVLYSLK